MGRRLKVVLLFVGLVSFGSACSTARLVRTPESEQSTEPAYTAAAPFFFMGLVGGPRDLFADRICLDRGVDQVEITYTTQNFVTTLLTVGIYAPRTVRVWCGL